MEKRYMITINTNLKFRVWKHDLPCALEKTIMAEVSRRTSERVNVINVFHGVNLILYTVANIYPMAGSFLNAINVFCSEKLALFTFTSIHSIKKAQKQKLWNNKMKVLNRSNRNNRRFKAVHGSNRSKGREIELINREVWRNRKKKRGLTEEIDWYIIWK